MVDGRVTSESVEVATDAVVAGRVTSESVEVATDAVVAGRITSESAEVVTGAVSFGRMTALFIEVLGAVNLDPSQGRANQKGLRKPPKNNPAPPLHVLRGPGGFQHLGIPTIIRG